MGCVMRGPMGSKSEWTRETGRIFAEGKDVFFTQ